MSTTYSMGVTNTTAWTTGPLPIKLGLETNYATVRDDAGHVVLQNKTASLDQQEAIAFKSRREKKVGPSNVPVYNPAKVQDAVLYSIDIQDILRKTDDQGVITDFPFEMWLTIKHPIDGVFTNVPAGGHSYVYQQLMRLIGACFHDDSTERFGDFAKGAIEPTAD